MGRDQEQQDQEALQVKHEEEDRNSVDEKEESCDEEESFRYHPTIIHMYTGRSVIREATTKKIHNLRVKYWRCKIYNFIDTTYYGPSGPLILCLVYPPLSVGSCLPDQGHLLVKDNIDGPDCTKYKMYYIIKLTIEFLESIMKSLSRRYFTVL